jgi:hypothetical protein
MISADFSNVNLENIEIIYKLFYYCPSLTYFNFSNVKTFNLTTIAGMFDYCISLTSIDLSSLYTNKPIYIGEIFYDNCLNLSYIDISSFKCINGSSSDMFSYLPNFGIIKVNKNCSNEIEKSIPTNWTLIIID